MKDDGLNPYEVHLLVIACVKSKITMLSYCLGSNIHTPTGV